MVAVTVCQIKRKLDLEAIDMAKTMDFEEENYKEEQYNRLADLLRNSLDMKKIYQILG